jgi:hypothetical protein
MQAKLAPLLDNHPEEEHQAIIAANHHILFGTAHKDRRQGKFKHDRDGLRHAIKQLPVKARRTTHNLAAILGLPYTSAF